MITFGVIFHACFLLRENSIVQYLENEKKYAAFIGQIHWSLSQISLFHWNPVLKTLGSMGAMMESCYNVSYSKRGLSEKHSQKNEWHWLKGGHSLIWCLLSATATAGGLMGIRLLLWRRAVNYKIVHNRYFLTLFFLNLELGVDYILINLSLESSCVFIHWIQLRFIHAFYLHLHFKIMSL